MVFYARTGTWKVLLADSYRSPVDLNLWEAWDIKYRPLLSGVPGTYDSGDPAVIREHLSIIGSAQIDFLLFDMTNHVGTSFILKRALQVCRTLKDWNQGRSNKVSFAVAIGATQFTGDPDIVEKESQEVYCRFIDPGGAGCSPSTQPRPCEGRENYFQLDGKPLLVVWLIDDQQRQRYEASMKPWSGKFTAKYMQGHLPDRSTFQRAMESTSGGQFRRVRFPAARRAL